MAVDLHGFWPTFSQVYCGGGSVVVSVPSNQRGAPPDNPASAETVAAATTAYLNQIRASLKYPESMRVRFVERRAT